MKNIGLEAVEKLLTVEQLAELLGLSPKTIRNWVYKGQIPHIKLHGALRFDRRQIGFWINRNSKFID